MNRRNFLQAMIAVGTAAPIAKMDDWYIKAASKGASTVYWFATGKKPDMSLLLRSTMIHTRKQILNVISASNPLFQRLTA